MDKNIITLIIKEIDKEHKLCENTDNVLIKAKHLYAAKKLLSLASEIKKQNHG